MLSIAINRLANKIVEQELLKKGGRTDEALYLNFALRTSVFTKANRYSEMRGLHLLYHMPNGSRSISVFSGITPAACSLIRDVREWKHEISHDSCWRDIRTFSNVYFEMAERINTRLEEDGIEGVAPADMYNDNDFNMMGEVFSFIRVSVSKDISDPMSYRKRIMLED